MYDDYLRSRNEGARIVREGGKVLNDTLLSCNHCGHRLAITVTETQTCLLKEGGWGIAYQLPAHIGWRLPAGNGNLRHFQAIPLPDWMNFQLWSKLYGRKALIGSYQVQWAVPHSCMEIKWVNGIERKVAHSCPTLFETMDYIVHGMQARTLEGVAFPS